MEIRKCIHTQSINPSVVHECPTKPAQCLFIVYTAQIIILAIPFQWIHHSLKHENCNISNTQLDFDGNMAAEGVTQITLLCKSSFSGNRDIQYQEPHFHTGIQTQTTAQSVTFHFPESFLCVKPEVKRNIPRGPACIIFVLLFFFVFIAFANWLTAEIWQHVKMRLSKKQWT